MVVIVSFFPGKREWRVDGWGSLVNPCFFRGGRVLPLSGFRQRFHDDGCAVAKHFRNARCHLGRIVSHRDNRVRPASVHLVEHELKGFGPGLLAQFGQISGFSFKGGPNYS